MLNEAQSCSMVYQWLAKDLEAYLQNHDAGCRDIDRQLSRPMSKVLIVSVKQERVHLFSRILRDCEQKAERG